MENIYIEFEQLIEKIKNQYEYSESKISKKAGRNQGYISQLKSRYKSTGELPPLKFIEALKLRFPLNNPTLDFIPGSQIKSNYLLNDEQIPLLPQYWLIELEKLEKKLFEMKAQLDLKDKIISNQNELIDKMKEGVKPKLRKAQ